MTRALLDVSVLIALLDQNHVHHTVAREWLTDQDDPAWSSCAITQNGAIRIMSQPAYPASASVEDLRTLLRRACSTPAHEFWPCDVSILGPHVTADRIITSRQVTDVYLLALAVEHGGRLVTLDRGVDPASVHGATTDHLVRL